MVDGAGGPRPGCGWRDQGIARARYHRVGKPPTGSVKLRIPSAGTRLVEIALPDRRLCAGLDHDLRAGDGLDHHLKDERLSEAVIDKLGRGGHFEGHGQEIRRATRHVRGHLNGVTVSADLETVRVGVDRNRERGGSARARVPLAVERSSQSAVCLAVQSSVVSPLLTRV